MSENHFQQIEAGRRLNRATKQLFDEFIEENAKRVKHALIDIAKRERKNTRDRLQRGDTLARMVGVSKRGVDFNLVMSGKKGDLGTIQFGSFQPVTVSPAEGRRASKLDNIAALLAGGAKNFARIGEGPDGVTAEQIDRGFVFGNNISGILPYDMSKVIKVGWKHPDIDPNPDYLLQAQENILDEMERRIPDVLVRSFASTNKPNRGKKKV